MLGIFDLINCFCFVTVISTFDTGSYRQVDSYRSFYLMSALFFFRCMINIFIQMIELIESITLFYNTIHGLT